MAVINRIAEFEPDMRAWRRHLHAIPELDFDLFETAAFVAERLREIGVDEIHEGIAKTGIVALIRGRGEGPVDRACAPTWTRCRSTRRATSPWQSAASRPDARLRPRRPHRDPARRGALPGRDPQLRRHASR